MKVCIDLKMIPSTKFLDLHMTWLIQIKDIIATIGAEEKTEEKSEEKIDGNGN